MKNLSFILVIVMCITTLAFAEEYQIRSKYPVSTGPMAAGTRFNPYIIENERGEDVGTIRSKWSVPEDSPMAPGTRFNPYIIEWEEGD